MFVLREEYYTNLCVGKIFRQQFPEDSDRQISMSSLKIHFLLRVIIFFMRIYVFQWSMVPYLLKREQKASRSLKTELLVS